MLEMVSAGLSSHLARSIDPEIRSDHMRITVMQQRRNY